MADKLDDKVSGVLHRDKDGSFIPPDEYVVFRPQDNAFPATLRFYREECSRIGCDAAQLVALDNLIARVDAWRAAHPDRLKLADVEPGECRGIPEALFWSTLDGEKLVLLTAQFFLLAEKARPVAAQVLRGSTHALLAVQHDPAQFRLRFPGLPSTKDGFDRCPDGLSGACLVFAGDPADMGFANPEVPDSNPLPPPTVV